jgi:hypothetical protein
MRTNRNGPRGNRAQRRGGQVLEEYVLILGLVVLPLLAALPAAVAVLQQWMARMAGWWGLPVP